MPEKRIMRRTPAASTPAKPKGAVTKRPSQMQHSVNEDSPVLTDEDEMEIRGGWGASRETIDSTSNYAQTFKPETKAQVIKILEAKPYAAFRRHWIDRVGIGKRPYVCLLTIGKDCPLCDIGDKPGAVTAFNIAVCSDDGTPQHQAWECGVKITKQLETFHNDPKIGPLDKDGLYFLVSKTEAQQRQQVSTMVVPVRGRDLLEDYGVPPLDAEQIERLMKHNYDAEIVEIKPRHELEEVAAEMTGDDVPTPSKGWGE